MEPGTYAGTGPPSFRYTGHSKTLYDPVHVLSVRDNVLKMP